MWIEEAALWKTCKKIGLAFLLNTISFRQFQIAQTKPKRKPPLGFWPLFFVNPIKPIPK
jgi:hypothetical protein